MTTKTRQSHKTYKRPSTRQDRQMGFPGHSIHKSGHESIKRAKHTTLFICLVPYEHCHGSKNEKQRASFHTTPEATLDCYRQYLTRQGYKKINKRNFVDPQTGQILVLSKRPPIAKRGKGDRYMARHVFIKG